MADIIGFLSWILGNIKNNIGWTIYFIVIILASGFLPLKLAFCFLLVAMLSGFIYCTYNYYIDIKEIEKKFKK